jgi:YidC/Oxa1 family membrane protein insertase
VDYLYTIIIYPIVQIIEFIFVFSQKIFKETGISIVFISGAVSVLSLPLYVVAERWQRLERSVQAKMAAGTAKIKAVFRGDEQYMILSAYYRQNHYHPVFALRSSFGLLIQIPFFIAAYSYLTRLEALKGAHFFFIRSLERPDSLVSIGGFSLNILPLAMTFINIIAGAVYLRGLPPKDKIQLYGMALVFLVLLYNSPAGLVLYWTLNNIFSLLKNIYYAVKNPLKNTVLFSFISALCVCMIYFILAIHKGDPRQRALIAFFSGFLGIAPWLFYAGKFFNLKFPSPGDCQGRRGQLFFIFIFSCAILWILSGVFIPSMLIVSSPQEFSYIDSYTTPLFFIFNSCLQCFGFFVFWPCCLYALFSGKTKIFFSFVSPALAVSALCNNFIFPGNYGLITVDLQFGKDILYSKAEFLLNAGILLFIIPVLIFLIFRTFKFFIPSIPILALVLASLSVFNVIAINREFRVMRIFHGGGRKKITSLEPLFRISRDGKNTVVIMLDRASSSFFPFILEESPDLYEAFSGFVYYPDTVSFNGYTRIGALPIFGGYEYIPQEINKRNSERMVDKHNEALLMLPLIFLNAGYEVTVTDPPYPNYSFRDDLRLYDRYPGIHACISDSAYTKYWLKEHNMVLPSTSDILKRDLFWYALFKMSPVMFRRGIYQYGDWCAPVSGQKITNLLNGYAVLDYLPRLTGLSSEKENTFLLMVNNATHEGALLQAPDYRPAINITSYGPGRFNKETEYHINIAAYKRLAEWFDFLKSADVYDNTRIILVSDHGSQISYVTKPGPGMPANFDNLHPILLVKDFGVGGKLISDNTFMTNADVPALALSGQIENPVNPFTGKAITNDIKKEPLYIAVSGDIHLENPDETMFIFDPKQDWYVQGGIFEESNWKRVEE